MTHSVHIAYCIMLQDTEGEHHGGTQLVLSSMPQTGMQTSEITQELHTPRLQHHYQEKSKPAHCSKNYFVVARGTAESKQNEPSLLPLCNCSAGVLSQRAHNPLNFCRVVLCRNKQEIVQKGFQLSRQDIIQPKKKKKSSIGRFLTFKMLQQTCFSSTEQHLAPCQLSQVYMQVSQHG